MVPAAAPTRGEPLLGHAAAVARARGPRGAVRAPSAGSARLSPGAGARAHADAELRARPPPPPSCYGAETMRAWRAPEAGAAARAFAGGPGPPQRVLLRTGADAAARGWGTRGSSLFPHIQEPGRTVQETG